MTRLARLTIPFSMLLFVFSSGAARQRPQRDTRPRTASISGRVTISGKAAANAKVVVTEIKDRTAFGNQDFSIEAPGSGVGEDYAVLTDADGRYRATGLPEGK